MSAIASSHILALLTWSFLPPLLAQVVLSGWYTLQPLSRPTYNPKSTQLEIAAANLRAQNHNRNARLGLIVAYLLWSLGSVYFGQGIGAQRNFYDLLGLPRETLEREGPQALKSHWRSLARKLHPDKVGVSGQERFVLLRKAVECLENDETRLAYELFGESILTWGKLNGYREWLLRGCYGSTAFYGFVVVSFWMLGLVRKEEKNNTFWRYLALLLVLTTEFSLLFRATPSPFLSFFLPSRLPFQQIAFLRQALISCSMALTQLAPLLFPPSPEFVGTPGEQKAAAALAEAESLRPLLEKIIQLGAMGEMEAIKLQQLEMVPLVAQRIATSPSGAMASVEERTAHEAKMKGDVLEEVKEHMIQLFIDMQLRSDAEGAALWESGVLKGRELAATSLAISSPPPLPPSISANEPPPPFSPVLLTSSPPSSPPPSISSKAPLPLEAGGQQVKS